MEHEFTVLDGGKVFDWKPNLESDASKRMLSVEAIAEAAKRPVVRRNLSSSLAWWWFYTRYHVGLFIMPREFQEMVDGWLDGNFDTTRF